MADNVAVTAGTGTTIHADEYTHSTLGSGKTQLVKLVDGTLDASTAIAAGNGTNGGALRVTIASDSTGQVALAAGTAAIGKLAANSGVDIGDVDVLSCALPTGAATAAKQPALGTAGTASSDVITVQGVASMTPIQIADNGGAITVDNGGTFAVQAACTLGAETTKVIGTVNVAAAQTIAVTNAGTFATQATLQAGTAEIGKLAAGTANIGDVDVASIAAGDNNIGNVDIASAIPAGTNNIGDVDVASFVNGKTIKRAVISGATSGDNTVIAAVADKKIKVLSLFLVAATAVTVRFESGAGGTALTGVMSIGANSGFVLPAPADPTNHWFETGVNTLLNMELGGAVQVSGAITYYEE